MPDNDHPVIYYLQCLNTGVGVAMIVALQALGVSLAGVAIDLSGISPGDQMGSVPDNILQSLGWFTVVFTAGLALVAYFFNARLRLGRADHERVKRQLAQYRSV